MYEQLKAFCSQTIPLTGQELRLIDDYFEVQHLKKKDLLLREQTYCNFIAFVATGSVRHFHVKDGVEKTCDISFEGAWVTDFAAFNSGELCRMNLQAMEDTTVFPIRKPQLEALYRACGRYETFGRIMTERVAERATEIAMSLSSEKPKERFQRIISERPDLFQRVPQKYIANFLGISPESLSRIRNRLYHEGKS